MRILRPEEVSAGTAAALKYGELSPEELKEAYALARASFTAGDLARYAELEECVSADDILREMEEAQKHYDSTRPS